MKPIAAVLCSLSLLLAHAQAESKGLDVEHAKVPLYDQVIARIREKVSERLGPGPLAKDRYFIIPFAYQNKGNDPRFSHSFMTVVRILGKGAKLESGCEFVSGRYRAWGFEAFNISWLPADFLHHPNLCVFRGPGALAIPGQNSCPISPGKNYSLQETLGLAVKEKVAVGMWGPYEITRAGFDRGVKRKRLLDSGKIKYRADDRLLRRSADAINCFHALTSIEEPFPMGGLLNTGLNMWGLNGTKRVLLEYKKRATRDRVLLEPINEKRDVYGFIYRSATGGQSGLYNPFKNASVYEK
jgi:hypothetical protein